MAQKGRVLLRDEPVLFTVPLRLHVEITSQIREALTFDKQRKELGSLLLETRFSRNVKELEARKLPEQRPVGAQVRYIRIKVSVVRINVSEGDHRHVFGRRISNAERKPVREGDAAMVLYGWREQALADLESLDKVSALGFRGLEIIFFRVSENEVESQEPGLDVGEFVIPPIAEIVFADGSVELPRAEVINETPARVSLGAGTTKTEQFFDQSGIALAALGLCKVQKLPHGEVAGMRGHKVEKPGLHFGIAEVKNPGELVFSDAHGLEA